MIPQARPVSGTDRAGVLHPVRDPSGRVPPHDLDAEAVVLSACMLDRDALGIASDILAPEHFYADANGRIFRAILALVNEGRPVDNQTVASHLRDDGTLALIGGPNYLAEITDATPAVAHVEAHARIVRDKARMRSLIAACQVVAAEGYSDVGDPEAWIGSAESRLLAVTTDRGNDVHVTMKDALREAMLEIDRAASDPGSSDPGVATGIRRLDDMIGAARPGDLVLVGGASGRGKSAFAMGMVGATAATPLVLPDGTRATQTALVCSAEMPRTQIAIRAAFGLARVNGRKARRPTDITPAEWGRLTAGAVKAGRDNVILDDRPGLTLSMVTGKARRVAAESQRRGRPLRLVVVDYLQIIDATEGGRLRYDRRDMEMRAITASMKMLAMELRCVVCVVAQLSDEPAKQKRRPRKEDVRECRGAGADCDRVILIDNPAATERVDGLYRGGGHDDECGAEVVDLIADKVREGGREGRTQAIFWPQFTLFTDAEDHELREG